MRILSRIAVAACVAVTVPSGVLLGGAPAALAAPRAPAPQPVPNGYWSGYIAMGNTFKSVAGSYTVPAVNCAVTPSSFSYHWVGLDGASATAVLLSGPVEQDGVGAFCNGHTPDYFAWAWMYPSPGELRQIPVGPGDAITSSVSYANGVYTLKLSDTTSGNGFTVTNRSTHPNSTAEAITEGYTTPGENGTADFGSEHYSGVTVTDAAGQAGGLASANWSTAEFVDTGTSGMADTQPGPLSTSGTGSSFGVTWENEH